METEESHLMQTSTYFGQRLNIFVNNTFFCIRNLQMYSISENVLKREIQFEPENWTYPGEQVVSYLINYRRLISLPNSCHLFQY